MAPPDPKTIALSMPAPAKGPAGAAAAMSDTESAAADMLDAIEAKDAKALDVALSAWFAFKDASAEPAESDESEES